MHYQNDTFLFLLQEVSLKYHKSSMKYHKSSIKAALKLHNEAPKVPLSSNATTYKQLTSTSKQLTHDISRYCPKTVQNFGHSMPAVTGNRCPAHGLSMPITWALSAHQTGIDRPTNGLISKRYQQQLLTIST